MTDSLVQAPPACHVCSVVPQWKNPPKSSRLPSGWKRRADRVFCSACWRKNYVLRAVTIPVASPLDCTWPELNEVLHEMWQSIDRERIQGIAARDQQILMAVDCISLRRIRHVAQMRMPERLPVRRIVRHDVAARVAREQ